MFRKEYFSPIIALAILLGCVFISGCTGQTPETGEKHEAGFYTYENTQYGFKINYPDTWTKKENYLADTIVTFMLQTGEIGLSVINGSLSISVTDVGSMSMEMFKEYHIENISQLYSQIYTDFNISYMNSTTLAGLSAYKLIYTYMQGVFTIEQTEIWTIKDSKLYLLLYIVIEEYCANYVDIIEQMIDSFEIM